MIKKRDAEIALSLSFIIILAVFTPSPNGLQSTGQILPSLLGTLLMVILIHILGNMELQASPER